MAHRAIIAVVFLFVLMVSSISIQAQSYRFSPYPDLWYNDVDGIRLGVRVLGEMEGTFKDGPHRLDAGVWVGSKLPEHPVSYYFSFTEPITTLSDFGSEGSVQFKSAVRTGFYQHQVRFNKRWQKGFDELDYFEGSVFYSNQKRFENEYVPYRYLWQPGRQLIVGSELNFSRNFNNSRLFAQIDAIRNLKEETGAFNSVTIEILYHYKISDDFNVRIRNFTGLVTDEADPQFKFLSTTGTPIQLMNRGFSRARGTIPQSFINDGFIHYGGGANLRGYQSYMANHLKNVESASGNIYEFPLHNRSFGLNLDVEFPNPINKRINSSNLIANIIELRSYVFFDAATGSGTSIIYDTRVAAIPDIVPPKVETIFESNQWLMDAGLGFQLSANILDYLGKDRGIFIRYDIPFWLSSTENNESNFKYRNIVGVGAIFNF